MPIRFTGSRYTDNSHQQALALTGDVILSQSAGTWDEIYAALDEAGFPEDFLADRGQGLPQKREEM